jgi:hypothetical protein
MILAPARRGFLPTFCHFLNITWPPKTAGRESFRAQNAKAAKARSDAMTLAQPFMAGSGVNQMKSPARDGRRFGGRAPAPANGSLGWSNGV